MARSKNALSKVADAVQEAIEETPVAAAEAEVVQEAKPLDITAVDLSTYTTESARIRALHALGFKNGPIAKELGRRRGRDMKYQHVRNVLATPIKEQQTAPTATEVTVDANAI